MPSAETILTGSPASLYSAVVFSPCVSTVSTIFASASSATSTISLALSPFATCSAAITVSGTETRARRAFFAGIVATTSLLVAGGWSKEMPATIGAGSDMGTESGALGMNWGIGSPARYRAATGAGTLPDDS